MGVEYGLLLARVRATGDPHRRIAETEIAHTEGVRRHFGVELDVASDLDGVGTQCTEPRCGVFVLADDPVDVVQHSPNEWPGAPIATEGTRG